MSNHCIVVARYAENMDWVDDLVEMHDWIDNVIIYNKGRDDFKVRNGHIIKVVKTPNIGREGETYLRYIIEHYNKLPQHVWFTQGDPFPHCPDFMNLLSRESVTKYNIGFQGLTWRYQYNVPPEIDNDKRYYINGNRLLQYYVSTDNLDLVDEHEFNNLGAQNLCRLLKERFNLSTREYVNYFCKGVGIKPPKNVIPFTIAAIFYVQKDMIMRHPLSVYKKIKSKLLQFDMQGGEIGYFLEMIWQYIFTMETYDDLEEIYEKRQQKFGKFCASWCKNRKHVWIKYHLNKKHPSVKTPFVHENSHNTTMIYKTATGFEDIEGIDFPCDDIESHPCDSLDQAHKLFDRFLKTH